MNSVIVSAKFICLCPLDSRVTLKSVKLFMSDKHDKAALRACLAHESLYSPDKIHAVAG